MRNVVAELRAEHANMAQLLDILEGHIKAFEAGGDTDYTQIQDIIQYFLDFPDKCHHPKEDVLAQTLLSLVPVQAAPLRGLDEKHQELGALLRRVAEIIDGVLRDVPTPRADVARILWEFVGSQRHHIQMEERHFLPLADEVLTRSELRTLEAEIFGREDPLFGAETAERFADLRAQILQWEQRG